ncbi:MAG: MFS transporter [Dehalococcoidales bacterium]|nr:MFS transporter [Dehalococcoidales bacterium]
MIQKVFPILAVSIFSAMLGVGLVSPLLPLYVKEMGATGPELGIIFAGYGLVNTIATPIIGRLSDRKGRKIFLSIGLFSYAIFSLGYVLAGNVPQLILVRLLLGGTGAFITPIAMAYIGDLSPEGEEGKWMGYANSAFFSGFGIGPLLGGALTDHLGANASFYSMSILNLLAFLLVIILLPEAQKRFTRERAHISFKEMSASPMIKGLFSFRMGQAIGNASIMTFLPVYAATQANLTPTLIGILLAANTLPMMIFLIPAGRLADKFNRRFLTVIGMFIYLLSVVFIPLMHNFWQLLLLCIPRAIGGSLSMPAATALTIEEGRKFGMGTTMAMLMMAMGIGFAIGAPISGVISDYIDINAVFYFAAIIGLISIGIFVLFTRKT